MPIKLSKAIKELNVGAMTIQDFLRNKGIEIDVTNVNARIADDVYELLLREYKQDSDQKQKSDTLTNGRRPKRSDDRSREIETVVPGQKPKILGKIDLSQPGKFVTSEPAKPAEPAKPTESAEPAPAETSGAAAPIAPPVAEPAKPVKPAEAAEPAPAATSGAAAPIAPPVAEPAESVKPAEPASPAAPEVKAAEEQSAPAAPAEPEVFKLPNQPAGPSFTIVGKIDLNAINSTTRPKPKSKEERRRERAGKAAGEAGGRRGKRARIGKEKVNIEQAAAEVKRDKPRGGASGQSTKQQQDQASRAASSQSKRKEKKSKRPLKPEVSDEDVQRQVKETLARLTTRTTKKGVKYRKEKREAVREAAHEEAMAAAAESKVLKLTEFVTANDLAAMMDIPVNKIIATCLTLDMMVSINQRLDAETINILAEEFGFKTEYQSADVHEAISDEADDPADLVQRPPVVTVMGHVDHGKTSLLDYIRKSNVIAGEAGGITQHIGAYNVKLPNGRRITFLDTPGHEAFTAMRARGAKVTDIVIVIVAADDSVMPQTIEALNHASAAGVPIVFAINKIDKPGANPEKIKEELSALNYLVEDWGGKYQSQDISAKKGIGVQELMEKVLLEADMLELKANPNRKAVGSIIESSLDRGRGYIATVLIENGTLHVGDIVLAGMHFGKVKAMFNERNQRITEAGPATPVLILGLNGAPTAGDKINVMETEQEARQIANKREQLMREQQGRTQKRPGLDDIARLRALGEFHELNLIVKGDVDGSIEALSDSLIKLSTPEVQVNVIHKAVGAITESDVTLAAASNASIIGFQVRPSASAKRLAEQEGVDIRIYSIIYDTIEEVKSAMEGMLSPEIKEEVSGTAEVKEVFHITRVGTIAGAIVREGKIKRTNKVRVIRDGIVIYTGNLASLKRFKDDAKEVATGFECGLSVQSYNDLAVGDLIEGFEEVQVQKTL